MFMKIVMMAAMSGMVLAEETQRRGGSAAGGVNCTASTEMSIFDLPYSLGLGSVGGMTLMTCMVAFMIIVDRIQVRAEETVVHYTVN